MDRFFKNQRHYQIISLSVLVLFTLACNFDKSISVRVGSYNVEFSKNTTPEEVGNMFKPYNLDIIGFNEVPGSDWTNRTGKVLDMKYYYVGKVSSANHKDKYKSILCRTPIIDTLEFTLEAERGWNPASVVKAVTVVKGISVAFYSLHICASEKVNGHAYKLVNDVLLTENDDISIVVGDFNNRIGDMAINTIEESGMQVIWENLGIDTTQHYTWNAFDSVSTVGVIDHIFYNTSSGGYAVNGGIIDMDKPLSDHKPIWADIVFPANSQKNF